MRYGRTLTVAACLLGAASTGLFAPLPADASARAAAPQTGHIRAVRIDGYSITTKCTGSATATSPTIVLLAGEADPLTRLGYVQSRLSRLTRVCSYDRPGAGTSSKPRTTQTLADSAALLHALLSRLDAGSHGVVLAGHSLGGLIAAEYASQYRRSGQVKALVLLDAPPPGIVTKIERLIPPDASGIAGRDRAEIVGLATGMNRERLAVGGAPIPPIGNVPLIVVQHGKKIFAAVPEYGRRIQQIWSQGQAQWLRLSTRSRIETARKSGHYIYLNQPGLTLRLIKQALVEGE